MEGNDCCLTVPNATGTRDRIEFHRDPFTVGSLVIPLRAYFFILPFSRRLSTPLLYLGQLYNN